MPVRITKVSPGRFKVATPHGVKAKGTSLFRAKKLKKLLNAIEHGWKPNRKLARNRVNY